jgi:putative sigma-54 modulation protein
MEVQITFRHSKPSDSLKESIKNEIEKLQRFYDRITSAHVIMDTESVNKTAEIVVNLYDHTVKGTAKAENVGKALDSAVERVERQLKKINAKMKSHKGEKNLVA